MVSRYLLVLVLTVVFAREGLGAVTDAVGDFKLQHQNQEITRERELANRLLHRLLDVAYETFKDLGGSDVELKEIQRKRALITTCYFQAISCY